MIKGILCNSIYSICNYTCNYICNYMSFCKGIRTPPTRCSCRRLSATMLLARMDRYSRQMTVQASCRSLLSCGFNRCVHRWGGFNRCVSHRWGGFNWCVSHR
ncbi:hypothetical protein B484DRAFT_112515 [Ochromonadaceae sp. CCMP2298]|nr:hypothetical protein B484DRAFT_112515 [Ochromonadaceae sp. CCMP2298]